jgi:pseudaminic acid biosynthesis-associated methylase
MQVSRDSSGRQKFLKRQTDMQFQDFSEQLAAWTSAFGQAYTDRNLLTPEEMDRHLGEYYGGVNKTEIFRQFLHPDLIHQGRVLEVGCNVGLQLMLLHMVNPGLELYGVEPQDYARTTGQALHKEIRFIAGSAFQLPFEDDFFDVVMTNVVLIHIHPKDLATALREIHRVSRRYIFLHEYFSPEPKEITYYGNSALLWKMNYLEQYQQACPDLQCLALRYLRYPDPDSQGELVDQIALLAKGNT